MARKLQTIQKVLVITGTWPPMPCGVGAYTACLCSHLAKQGMQVHVLTSQAAHPDMQVEGAARLEVHPLVQSWSWTAWGMVKRMIAEIRPDTILFEWPTAAYGRSLTVNGLPYFIRKTFPEIPLITGLHEYRYFNALTRLRIWTAMMFSSRVVVVDPLDLDELRIAYPKAMHKCSWIPIGSNLPRVSEPFNRKQTRLQLGIKPNDFVVVFFGFANPPKGVEDLVAAMQLLRKKHQQVRLLELPGLKPENEYHKRLLMLMEQAGLTATMLQPEYAEKHAASEMLACGDCAALPYRDGASLKRGSMFACLELGLPVVTTEPQRLETFPFQNGKHLLTVPVSDPAALAQAIEKIVVDPGMGRQFAKQVKAPLAAFAWDRIAEQHVKLFADA